MIGADAILAMGVFALAGLIIAAVATLKGWQGWLELKKLELARAGARREETTVPTGGRIEIADLKERVRKLEAIADGIES